VGTAIPYGVYDRARNEAWVSVGSDHDTPAFAVASIRQWWTMICGRPIRWPTRCTSPPTPAAATGIGRAAGRPPCSAWPTTCGCVSTSRNFPPGTSKWNKVEHRLFCHITQNWRGRALRTFDTLVELIGHTRTATGLGVKAKLDKRRYKTGLVVTKAEMRDLALHPHAFTATGTMNSDRGQRDHSIKIRGLRSLIGARV
jgi:hypothetical protein